MEGRQIGSWIIESEIAEGGMGKVYLARHRLLNTRAAIKMLATALARDAGFRERFFREAQTQARLIHPHIAQVIDYIEQDGLFYLVIEYLAGGSFDNEIKKAGGPVDLARVLPWIKQVLVALDYAHQQGVIHRDIKPSNIMLDYQGKAKVVDFGIALNMEGRRVTSTGMTLGTPHYMSPEQITRPRNLDHRTDVYSIGVVLYELLTGRVPFDGDTDFSVRAAQVHEPPASLRSLNPAIPLEVEEIVLKALAKDPARRYSGCGEFAWAIEDYERGQSIPPAVKPERPPTVVEMPPHRTPTVNEGAMPLPSFDAQPNPVANPYFQNAAGPARSRGMGTGLVIGAASVVVLLIVAAFIYNGIVVHPEAQSNQTTGLTSNVNSSVGATPVSPEPTPQPITFKIYDHIGTARQAETVSIDIDGKNAGVIEVTEKNPYDYIVVTLPKPGRYSYTVSCLGRFYSQRGGTFDHRGAGQETIEFTGKDLYLYESVTGSTWLIHMTEEPYTE
jgi:serine/threonine-protein kinase